MEYQKRVYNPFVNAIRETDCGWVSESGVVPEWLKCAAWCDGCQPQLYALMDEEIQALDRKNGIERPGGVANSL